MDRAARPALAFVLPSLAGGGAERVTLTLLGGMDPARWDRHLLLFDASGPLASQIPPGVQVHDLKRPRLRQALPAVVRELRRLRPAVTFSSLGYVNLALAACRPLFGGAVMLREANLPSLSLPRSPFPRLMPLAYRLLYPKADRLLATSARMADELKQLGAPSERLAILPNPVDVDRLRRLAHMPRRMPGGGLRLVAAGRLVEQKGFDRLIPLLAGTPELRLTILGDGPQRSLLSELASRHGVAVDMPGFTADAPAWFAGADAVVIPSRWEGMPNVALEALACGTPVIATPESGGIAEVADAAVAGAVAIAAMGLDFVAAVRAAQADPSMVLRPSLLPSAWEMPQVIHAFAGLCGLAATTIRQPVLHT